MQVGIQFFPLETVTDDRMKLIEAEFGLTGFGVAVRLWQKIYSQSGYYIEWNDEVALLFAKDVGLGGSVVSEIVSALIRRNIFDQVLYKKYHILTSKEVQERYLEAVKRRKTITVFEEFLLIDVTLLSENVNIIKKNVCKNPKNVCTPKQTIRDDTRQDDNIYSAIIEHLNLKAGTHYQLNSKYTKKYIKARLEDKFTKEDFFTVIDKKCALWKGTEMQKFLRPETLFGTKFESYLNEIVPVKRGKTNFIERNYSQEELDAKIKDPLEDIYKEMEQTQCV